MIVSERARELIRELHEELNATGEYNTFVVVERLSPGYYITMNCHTAKKPLAEEEKKSLSRLFDKIHPYFRKRTEDFKEKAEKIEQTPIKSLHIDKLIGQFVVVNIPSEDNRSLNLSPEYLAEQVKKALESVLLKSEAETCTYKETSQKEHPCNTPQS